MQEAKVTSPVREFSQSSPSQVTQIPQPAEPPSMLRFADPGVEAASACETLKLESFPSRGGRFRAARMAGVGVPHALRMLFGDSLLRLPEPKLETAGPWC